MLGNAFTSQTDHAIASVNEVRIISVYSSYLQHELTVSCDMASTSAGSILGAFISRMRAGVVRSLMAVRQCRKRPYDTDSARIADAVLTVRLFVRRRLHLFLQCN